MDNETLFMRATLVAKWYPHFSSLISLIRNGKNKGIREIQLCAIATKGALKNKGLSSEQ